MNQLTIEQLKSLEVGDWVWITNGAGHLGSYVAKASAPYEEDDKTFNFDSLACSNTYPYSTYGTKWVAYKNKEQAEAKGEIIELPCIREIEDFVKDDGTRVRMKELNYMERGRIYSIPYTEGQFEEAERRLAELTKE